jgi:hypothetical protein
MRHGFRQGIAPFSKITQIAEKVGLWWRSLSFVVTASYERRDRPAPDPEYPLSSVQDDSSARYPMAGVITLETEIRS